jgi:hypothetical protein
MLFLSYIISALGTRVLVEPLEDTGKALSCTKLNSGNALFDFQSIRRKEMSGIYCMTPIIVPVSLVDYRFYFCGELMCYKDMALTVCDKADDRATFHIKKIDRHYTIGKDGKCLHVYKGNLFLRKCDELTNEQLFAIEPVKVPLNDNIDIEYDRRALSGGVKEINFDNAMREFSKIRHSEFVDDLLINKRPGTIDFKDQN